jgi:phospholipase C
MTKTPDIAANRRQLLQMAGAGLGLASLATLQKAMATPANNKTGTIMDVEHVVIFMQENRAFDHYFGAFPGVRGQGDPRPLRLRNGHSVWRQPSDQHPDGYVMPYWADSKTANAYVVDGADQGHDAATIIVNGGHYDQWGVSKQLHNRMTHYKASDLPFYHALAANFTICDAYHCSTLTQTYPNRLHLWTGCNGAGRVGGEPVLSNYGEDETPSADMAEDRPIDAYTWTTYAERLERPASTGRSIRNTTILATISCIVSSPSARATRTHPSTNADVRGFPSTRPAPTAPAPMANNWSRPSALISPQASCRRCRGSSPPPRFPSIQATRPLMARMSAPG